MNYEKKVSCKASNLLHILFDSQKKNVNRSSVSHSSSVCPGYFWNYVPWHYYNFRFSVSYFKSITLNQDYKMLSDKHLPLKWTGTQKKIIKICALLGRTPTVLLTVSLLERKLYLRDLQYKISLLHSCFLYLRYCFLNIPYQSEKITCH